MGLSWIAEPSPRWDTGKRRIVGDAAPGIFDRRYRELEEGDVVPAMWWRAEEDGEVVGYGWLDVVWGDAEILLAVLPSARGRGIGSFILEKLEDEARKLGLGYLYNVVRPSHPEREEMSLWLRRRGFRSSEDGSLLRAAVSR